MRRCENRESIWTAHAKSPRRALAALLLAGAFVLAALAPAGAHAEGAPSAAGTWSCCGSGGAGEQVFSITESGGQLSGEDLTASGEEISPLSGSITGGSVTIVTGPYTHLPTYTATFVGTVSGTTMSGTWKSNVGQEGTWSASRTGPPKASKQEEEATKRKEEEAKAKRKSAIQISCEVLDPFLPSEYDQCTAVVGDASGRSPAEIPTGKVSFAIAAGGSGGFRGSSTCALAPSQTGGASSFCAVTYLPGSQGLPVGTQPPIVGTYEGDANFQGVSNAPTGAIARAPLTEESVFASLCAATSLIGCEANFPPPPSISEICVTIGTALGVAADACDSPSTQALTLAEEQDLVVASTDCPSAEGALTQCELELLWKGEAPPDLRAKAEYIEKTRVYGRQVTKIRDGVLETVEGYLYSPTLYPNEDAEFRQARAQRATAEKEVLIKAVNDYFDKLTAAGTPVPENGEVTLDPSKRCPALPGEVSSSLAQGECEVTTRLINAALKAAYEQATRKKEEFGLTRPFKSTKASASAISAGKHRTRHPARGTLLAYHAPVRVKAGKTAKVRLTLPPYARADLKRLRAHGIHSLKTVLFERVSLSTGGSHTRKIMITLKLTAKRHASNKKR